MFTTVRLRPGALLTTIEGHDDGQLGGEPIAIVDREHARFGTPVSWFIDARAVDGISGGVLDTWTQWLATRPTCLDRMHVLLGGRSVALNLEVARHLSGISANMHLHHSPPSFDEAVRSVAGAAPLPGAGARPVSIEVEPLPRNGFEVRGSQLAYRFECPEQGTVVTRVSGRETGELGDAVLDAFDALLRQIAVPVSWHLDLERVTRVAPARAQAWAAWLQAREPCFRGIEVFAPSPSVALFLLGAQYRFRNAGLMQVVREAGEFRRSR